MAGDAVKHDYHLVEPSPWPFVGSVAAFVLAVGGVTYMKGLFGLEQGSWWILGPGIGLVLYTMIGWWGDIVKESRAGDHTPVVEIGLRYGMILFIASEVMFFVAWFWVFFEGALFHEVRAVEGWITQFGAGQAVNDAWASWPPPTAGEGGDALAATGAPVKTFDPWHLPLLNTLILLTSGTTVTWAHHTLEHGKLNEAKMGLLLTVILGVAFSFFQYVEYTHAGFPFAGHLYGAASLWRPVFTAST